MYPLSVAFSFHLNALPPLHPACPQRLIQKTVLNVTNAFHHVANLMPAIA